MTQRKNKQNDRGKRGSDQGKMTMREQLASGEREPRQDKKGKEGGRSSEQKKQHGKQSDKP